MRRLLFATMLSFLAACGKPPRNIPATSPSIAGRITRIESQGRNTGQILVEENPDETSGSPKARVKVTPATHIVRRGGHITITAGDLRPGQRVSVWYAGPVLDSYPVQAAADVVMLEDVPVRPAHDAPSPPVSHPLPAPPPAETPATDDTAAGDAVPGDDSEGAGARGEEAPPPADGGATPSTISDGSDWTAGIVERPSRRQGTAVLRTVRQASHPAFDRVVFEFDGAALPRYHIEYVDRPVRECGSGEPVAVAGDAWLEIRLDPAAAHTGDGRSTVTPKNRRPGFPVIEQIVATCDFEGHVTWVLGVSTPHQYMVHELSDPARLVIDVRH